MSVPRTALAVLAGAVLLVTSGCAPPERTAELEYPSAPAQRLPEPAAPAQVPAPGEPWVPTAQLADDQWLQTVSARTGIPQRVLAAYTGAALLVAQTRPDCGLGWNTLAGIGQVESRHGSYADARVDDQGQVAPQIIGVPLDGAPGLAEIPDTDGGELDHDDRWDRAVGPLQFIPSTWEAYAQDGDRDGQADPHQYDDAALTAAVYLCEHGDDLSTDSGWVDAVTAYNQSVQYVSDVAAHAQDYVSPGHSTGSGRPSSRL